MKLTYIYVPQYMRILVLVLLVISSGSYAFSGDRLGLLPPDTLSISQWLILQPTAEAAIIMQDRIKADILVFMFWFVFQACGLVAFYFACCIALSGPKDGGKNI
jgi:hypothetical protein